MSKTTTTTTTTQTSGSDEDLLSVMDERKRKRMLSNRESARRSRMRKRQRMDELTNQVAQLQAEKSMIAVQANLITQQYVAVEAVNSVLRAEVMGLTERLQSLNSVLRVVEEVSGMAMDVPEMMFEPWKIPCLLSQSQQIMASADMFY